MSFYVYSFMSREVREGTGLIGMRDPETFETYEGAAIRREEIKKNGLVLSDLKAVRHVIRSEEPCCTATECKAMREP